MRIFILANGEATRWENYLGVDKQLIEIDGETIINRMVRLCRKYGLTDIVIVGPYEVDGATNFIPEEEINPIGKYEVVKPLTSDITEFALLYGDCYYSEKIIEDLATRKTDKKWLHWTCNRPNSITGKPYPEGYIHTVYDKDFWFKKCDEYHTLLDSGLEHKIDWQFLRFLLNIDLDIHQPELMQENEVDWEDESDDIDYPIDYDRWMENVKGIKI